MAFGRASTIAWSISIDDTLAQILPHGYTIDTAVRSYIVLMETEGKTNVLPNPMSRLRNQPLGRSRGKARAMWPLLNLRRP